MEKGFQLSSFSTTGVPKFLCPHCGEGHLIANIENIVTKQPAFSQGHQDHQDWSPDWEIERFSLPFKCDKVSCGEYAFLIGETGFEEYYEEEVETWVLASVFIPKAMFPAPMVISLPERTPKSVVSEIAAASSLIWTDLDACANRLRTAVERLLDDLKIPKRKIVKGNKEARMDLYERIELFGKTQPDYEVSLQALRQVGNLGSHGDSVRRNVLSDAFEVFEYSLEEMLGMRKARIDEIRNKIISNKGVY
ncbi:MULTISPECIES: DUF4145 domain-containing protein [unclassified Pseudomonas]|uniref:DUF4145 domain-containing protein n=1 Tax=unclassified Pseudomonas TaxID=196821 RepID=UPI0023624ADB|nr:MULTISPECIES: DUF4145 domain-containing protein [unclassified Pseudomonas]